MPAYSAGYDPSAPLANAQGLVAVPNVDLATAVVDQIMALQSYKANADCSGPPKRWRKSRST